MTTYTNQTKHSSSYSNGTKHTSTFSNTNKTGGKSPAGLYYGFGCFTYSGGQSITGSLVYNNQTKS